MKTVIPEQVIHHCDKCKKEISANRIDCVGAANFTGRDFTGMAVGGYRKDFELCSKCAIELEKFLDKQD